MGGPMLPSSLSGSPEHARVEAGHSARRHHYQQFHRPWRRQGMGQGPQRAAAWASRRREGEGRGVEYAQPGRHSQLRLYCRWDGRQQELVCSSVCRSSAENLRNTMHGIGKKSGFFGMRTVRYLRRARHQRAAHRSMHGKTRIECFASTRRRARRCDSSRGTSSQPFSRDAEGHRTSSRFATGWSSFSRSAEGHPETESRWSKESRCSVRNDKFL